MIQEFFNGKEPCRSINPDEAVAYGAAVQAAILGGSDNSSVNNMLLIDVAPLSMGIETAGNIMTTIIPRNSKIPCAKTETFSTYSDNQSAVTIKVFEGERTKTIDNHQLGTFNLEGIPPAPRGVPQIQVSFDLDANGILSVTAEDKKTGNKNKITITNESGRLSQNEIKEMIENAERFAEQDKAHAAQIQARNGLESYAYSLRNSINQADCKLSATDKKTVGDAVDDAIAWLDSTPNAGKTDYETKQKALERICNPILAQMYGHGAQDASNEPNNTGFPGSDASFEPNVEAVD